MDAWYPMLRILRLEDCKISTLAPLSSCPFLQEIHLKNNEITELTALAALTICEDLEVIDLRQNPVNNHSHLSLFVRVFFQKIQVCFLSVEFLHPKLPEDQKELEEFFERFRKLSLKPLKVIAFMKPIFNFLDQYVTYDETVSEKIASFAAVSKIVHEQNRVCFL